MKEYLKAITQSCTTPLQGRNLVREYLQAAILSSLQRSGAMIPLAFHGGTALRFLFFLPRHSEDIDFALERPESGYNFHDYLKHIQRDLAAEGYRIEIKMNDKKSVHSAFIKFSGILHELRLSPYSDEKLSVKIEVDTHPPEGAKLQTQVVQRHFVLQLQHHDRASLLAGKIHSILERPYVKGRDFYDLLWFLSHPDWPEPNIEMLNSALRQTDRSHIEVTADNWRDFVRQRLEELDWQQVAQDVRPFLEHEHEVNLLTKANLLQILDRSF